LYREEDFDMKITENENERIPPEITRVMPIGIDKASNLKLI